MTLQNHVLAETVRNYFDRDSRLSNQCIDVEVSDRDIVLIGCASSEELKKLAEEVASGVPGVRHIENRILIKCREKV